MKNAIRTLGFAAIASIALSFALTACPSETTTVPVSGVTLDKSTLSLSVGGAETLTATVTPDNATNKAVSWATSDAEKVTVANGVVTAVAEGTATITVTTADGNKTDTCSVTVTLDLTGTITVSPSTGVTINTELTATYSGSETVSFQWEKDGSNEGTASTTNPNKYTPTTVGIYTVTLSAEGYNSKTSVPVTVTTGSGTVPTITTATLPNGKVGTAYSQKVTATGDAPITWSVASSTLPTGLSLAPTTGVISGTPTTAATSTFTVKATNSAGSNTKQLSITIARSGGGGTNPPPTITAPTITTASLTNGTIGTAYSQTVTATGTTPITWSIDNGTLPAGLTLSAAGVISGTPTTAGTSTFTVRAANSAGNNTKQLSITIVIGIPTFTSIANFKTWLDAQPANTAATAYNVKLNVSDLAGKSYTSGSTGGALHANWGKYVSLDFSGSTFTSIVDEAFYYCTNLISVTMPNSVTSIGDIVFDDCDNLTAINVDSANNVYSSDNGILYNKAKTTLIQCPVGKTGAVTIPNSVTSVRTPLLISTLWYSLLL